MTCPDCGKELKSAVLKGITILECAACRGKWLGRDQLVRAREAADEGLRWLDFDPFGGDAETLSVVSAGKPCPQCHAEMRCLTYALSNVIIQKCVICHGVWLAHGELAKIIRYLEKTVNTEPVKALAKDSFKEFIKIFTVRKGLVSEVKDFLAVLNILKVRIAVEHPQLAQAWESIETISPVR